MEDLSLDDQKKVALKLANKKDIKKLQKLEASKQKALKTVSLYNGQLSEQDKADLENAERRNTIRPDEFTDPEIWALKRKRDKEDIKNLGAIQEAEHKHKSSLDQSPRSSQVPIYKADLHDPNNRYELFNNQGQLINVNGFCIDLNGDPVTSEVLSKKGVTLYINDISVKHIVGYEGCIRAPNGNILSVKGPPFREEIRDGDGRLIAINGKRVLDNREDIDFIVGEIEKIARGERNKSLKEKILGKVLIPGAARLSITDAFVKRILDQCLEDEQSLKAEAKRAKKMEAYLKSQEKADKKAEGQESKNRAKHLKKELKLVEKKKKEELAQEIKDRKMEEDRKLKNAKLKEEAREMAGIELSNDDFGASGESSRSKVEVKEDQNQDSSKLVSPEDFPTTIWNVKAVADADKPKDVRSSVSCNESDSDGPTSTIQITADKEKDKKIKAFLEVQVKKSLLEGKPVTLEQILADNLASGSSDLEKSAKHQEEMLRVQMEMRVTEDQLNALKKREAGKESKMLAPVSDTSNAVSKENETSKEKAVDKNEIAMAKQMLKHQEKMAKMEESYRKKEETRLEKGADKEHTKKLAEIKAKDKQHEKDILKRTKDLKTQEKMVAKEWKDKDKQHKTLEKEQAKELKKKHDELKKGKGMLKKEQERIKKEELSAKKNQLKSDKERLSKAKEVQEEEDKDAKNRQKEISELMKVQEKKLEKEKAFSEKQNKLLDKKLQRENKERLEEIKMQQKQEDSEAKMREREITELEKLQQKQAAKDLERVRKELKLQEKAEDRQAKFKVLEMKDIQKANDREVKERAKEIEKMEKEQAKIAAKELEKLQFSGKVKEKNAAKEARLQIKKMKDEQSKADKEMKMKAKEMEKLQKEQQKMAEKETFSMKKEELEQAKKEKKEMADKLKQIKADMKKYEQDAEQKLKEIEKIEQDQDKEAVKEMEQLKKEGKIQEKIMEKETKARLKRLRNEQKLQETENKRHQKEIEQLEQEECKKAEKELERIKKEGKYRESQESKEMKTRMKKLKDDQKKKDKDSDKRQKERAALEKMEQEIMIQQALLLNDAEKMKRLDETLISCKDAIESKERLKQETNDLIEQEVDFGTRKELRAVSSEIEQLEEEQKILEEDKENLKNEEEYLENQEQELQVETEILIDSLPQEWKNKIAKIKAQQAEADEVSRQIKEKLAEMKRSHLSKMNEVDLIEGEVQQLLKENVSPENMDKINKYRNKKADLQKKIEDARQQFNSKKVHLAELSEKEQELKDQEDEVLLNEEGDLKELMEVKMEKAEQEHVAHQMENELDILMVENKAVSQELHQVAAREEMLLSYEQDSETKMELVSVRKEESKAKKAYNETLAKIQSTKEAIEKEVRRKMEIEIKEKEIIKSKVTDKGKSKLKEIEIKLKQVSEDKNDVKNLMVANAQNESVCQKELIDAEKEEEKSLYKDLNKEAKEEFKRLKKLQKQEQKEVRKKQKDVAKAKKLQEKSLSEKDALQKREMKILEKEAAKEMKGKIKELKREKKEQEKAKKTREKMEKALVQKEIKVRKKEQALKAKEETILEKSLKKETVAKVKELKKAQKDKDKEAKRLAKEAKVLEKAREKGKKQKGKSKASKLDKLQVLQEEYEKLKASRNLEVEELEEIVTGHDEEIVKVEKEIEVIQESEVESEEEENEEDGMMKNSNQNQSDSEDELPLIKNRSDDSIRGVKSLEKFEVESSVTTTFGESEEEKEEGVCDFSEVEDEIVLPAKDKKKFYMKIKKIKNRKKVKKDKKVKKGNNQKRDKTLKKEQKQLQKEQKKIETVSKKEEKTQMKLLEKDALTGEKAQKLQEKHAKEIEKEVEKHQKQLRKKIEKEQKKTMKIEKKKLKEGMKKQLKEPATTNNMAGVLGKEVLNLLTKKGGAVNGEANKDLLIEPLNFVEDPENKGQNVIKELCRSVLLQKLDKFDTENLVLKNEIKTLRFALEACQEKNTTQVVDYEERIGHADAEIADLEGYRDNAETLIQQVNAMHQKLHYMINPAEYEKMETRVQMLNRRILKFKSQRDCLLSERNRLGEVKDELKFKIKVERQHKKNAEERMQNEARLCNNYRDKFLALEKKFDAYTKKTITEQRRILFEYGYQVKDNAFQDKSQTVRDLKDRIVKLELVVKEKENKLNEFGSLQRKEENANSLLDEVQLQMNRMTKANDMYQEEEKLLRQEYEVQAEKAMNNRLNEFKTAKQGPSKEAYRECNKLKKQIKQLQNEKNGLQVLVEDKEHTIKTMAMNQGHICTPEGRSKSDCEQCKEGTHVVSKRIRKKLMFPFRHGASPGSHQHKHNIKSQIVINPDAEIPTQSQKERQGNESSQKKYKRQLFRIQEAERAAKILFKEIQDRFGDKNQKKGTSMVEQLATTLVNMMGELKEYSNDKVHHNLDETSLNTDKGEYNIFVVDNYRNKRGKNDVKLFF